MQLHHLQINHIENPVGYRLEPISSSWQVSGGEAAAFQVDVSLQDDFADIVYSTGRQEDLSPIAVMLDLPLSPRTRYYWRVTAWDRDGHPTISSPATFETGKRDEAWQADFITPTFDKDIHPVMRRSFTLPAKPVSARLYICGLGIYEAYCNGRKAGDEYLAPYVSEYASELQVQTYDVTELLETDNQIEVMLGNGWYKGRYGLNSNSENYGDRFALIAELHIELPDGSHEVIVTDPHWTCGKSPIFESGIYDGESIDARIHEPADAPVERIDLDKSRLCDRLSLPVKIELTRRTGSVIHTPKGETVLDFGQNMAGFVQFTCDAPAGTQITLDFGEVLQDDCFYNENYRSARSRFTYISDGTRREVRPHFTFFGFRYVRVEGWPGAFDPAAFTACVLYSDLRDTGCLETSDPMLNRLIANTLWSQRANFIDIPTDCPQRDERLGWTGDAQVFASTACYNMDGYAFYKKWLHDLYAEQKLRDGSVPSFTPCFGIDVGTSAAWGDSATIIPDVLYRYYGDEKLLANQFPMMRDWVDWIERQNAPEGGNAYIDGSHYGDWLGLDGPAPDWNADGGTDKAYIAKVYTIASARLTAKAAGILGKTAEQEKYQAIAERRREAFISEYFGGDGLFVPGLRDTQTTYILPLYFDLCPDPERLFAAFLQRLEEDRYTIYCGFVGAPLLCETLSRFGRPDLAFDFIFQKEYPSWLYPVTMGATTIWERWNSLMPDGKVSGIGMNSFNHYAFGSITGFLYGWVAGLRPAAPGFRRAIFDPHWDDRLSFARCAYDSVSGRYVCGWERQYDGRILVRCTVPCGCTAELYLAGHTLCEVETSDGCYTIDRTDGTPKAMLTEGSYHFTLLD